MPNGPARPEIVARARQRRRRVRRRRAVLTGSLLVVVAVVATVVALNASGGPAGRHRARTAAPTRATRGGSHHGPASTERTFLGPDGVESTTIIDENRLPGTTAWQIAGQGAGLMEGFANVNYAAVGDTVQLYVSTSAPTFHVVAFRMGWYQGKGARQIWTSPDVAGTVQPACPTTPLVNMTACDNWTPSLSLKVTNAFPAGDYLLKLIGSGNQQSYVLLTVWDPSSTATYVVMNRSLTEEGWNTFGGFSFYQGEGPCLLDPTPYPVCNRARIVSFDRPFSSGNGSSDFLSNEFPLIQYMERSGLDVTYATDITIDEHPSWLLQHRALLSLGHDELWTYAERESAQNALAHGVNVAFMGAASVLRHARLQPSSLGPDREEVDYRNEDEDPLNGTADPMEVTGNTWSSPPTSWPETGFVGEEYSGYLEPGSPNAAFVVEDGSAWIFKGTGLHDGSSIPGIIASDIDHVDPSVSIPDLEVLGHSPVPLSSAYTNQGDWGSDTYSDMTYYTEPSGDGGVFDSGDNNWIYAMQPCVPASSTCPATTVDQITGNLLWLFGQGPAGKIEPSVSNLQSVVPAGS